MEQHGAAQLRGQIGSQAANRHALDQVTYMYQDLAQEVITCIIPVLEIHFH